MVLDIAYAGLTRGVQAESPRMPNSIVNAGLTRGVQAGLGALKRVEPLMLKFGWNSTLGQTIRGMRFRVQYLR